MLLQVKRIHEYKRQFLNVLGIIDRYHNIKTASPEQRAQVRPIDCSAYLGGGGNGGGITTSEGFRTVLQSR